MNDPHPSHTPPPDAPVPGLSVPPDVSATLADLERKLHELELELAAVRGHAPADPPGASAPLSPPPPLSPPAPEPAGPPVGRWRGAHLVDEALGSAGPLGGPTAPGSGHPPTVEPATPSAAGPAAASAPAELIAEVRQRMAGVATQLEELMRLRRELELRAHQSPIAPAPPAPTPPAPSAGDSSEDVVFEGAVVLDLGPFSDLGAVGAIERALRALPQARRASVREYRDNRAVIDLDLDVPVALLRDLRYVLGLDFSVLVAAPGQLSLSLESSAPTADPPS